jgi:hypothetical protein
MRAAAQKSLNEWIDSEDGRERARQRVMSWKRRCKEDSDRLAKLGPRGNGGSSRTAKRKNLQKDKEDLALEQERLNRVDGGRPLNGREVTERERLGFGSPQIALLDVNRSMDRKVGHPGATRAKQGQFWRKLWKCPRWIWRLIMPTILRGTKAPLQQWFEANFDPTSGFTYRSEYRGTDYDQHGGADE